MQALFRVYCRLWCATTAVHLYMNPFLVPHPLWSRAQAALLAGAAAYPVPATFVLANLACIGMFVARLPFIWTQCIWAMQTDAIVVGALLLCPQDAAVPTCSDLIRVVLGLFYCGAGLWKLNTSFLNPRVSCAPILAASLATRLPELTPAWLVSAALAMSPHLTVVFELGPGVLLLMPSRAARRLGVLLVVLLHYAIAMTPYPNAISQFGVVAVTRMFFVLPDAYAAALAECFTVPTSAAGATARAAAAAFVAYTASCTDTPGMRIDWGMPLCAALCVIATRAVAIDTHLPAGRKHGRAPQPSGPRKALLRVCGALALLLAASYSFAFHLVGMMDMSTVSPFSNLRCVSAVRTHDLSITRREKVRCRQTAVAGSAALLWC